MNGKTLFFNTSDGNGIIITQERKKIVFSVQNWDDFDVMPTTGLEVVFDYIEGEAFNIISKESAEILQEQAESDSSDQVEVDQQETEDKSEIDENHTTQTIETTNALNHDGEHTSENQEALSTESEEDEYEEEFLEEADDDRSETLPDEDKLTNEEENKEEHFELEPSVEIIDEINEELEKERPESITNTLNINTAVKNYFDTIQHNIDIRKNYKKVSGRLDYVIARRFLWTTYNNLIDIDINIITPKIRMLSDDLKTMGKVYDGFKRKVKYPHLAYEEVFLSSQAEYQKIKDGAEALITKLKQLKNSEKVIGGVRNVKKQELEKVIKTEQFTLLKEELKSLNGAYVDVVHMMAELDERYKQDLILLKDFEAEYREDFYALFSVEAQKHQDDLVDILNAQAYFFDAQQWMQAKTSKAVKAHFRDSSIHGELNTKTYLKYFLSTQDEYKATGDTQKLFELYDYLVSVHKDYIMVVTASAQEAMEYESAIKTMDKSLDIKSFIDEKAAIKWAMTNSVKILVVEEVLQKVRVEKFLNIYQKNILSIPNIILIGNKPALNIVSISKLIPGGASPRLVAQNVQSLIESQAT
ncbi:hypothetical protein GJV85_08930 [Sulfurimonas aquatica]|uniref:Uncharacterized protein n=1 Tax=Sulfurimonas aquatica TaxID=2672570 RepID=A0A975GD03_9BACT|nr:hypothetical protein [Sulfurimonas aquatica]QSZ42231.1 hypothetical protein GJV85_08930 [Sulfurimonas aquatica]